MKKLLLILPFLLFSTLYSQAQLEKAPNLNNAQEFAVLGGSVANVGTTLVYAKVGSTPGAIVGFPPGVALGGINPNNMAAQLAQDDAEAAYNFVRNQTPTTTLTNNQLGFGFSNTAEAVNGESLTPGVYKINGNALLSGQLRLDGSNRADAVFIFQIDGDFVIDPGSVINVRNGAQPRNIFFQVTGNVSVGTGGIPGANTTMKGNLLVQGNITLSENASLEGRALAFSPGGIVTLNNNTIFVPNITELDLRTTKTVSAGPYKIGDIITYTITVRNFGPDDATGVQVTDPLSSKLEFVDGSFTSSPAGATFSRNNGVITIGVGNLDFGQEVVLTFRARILESGTISNSATATSTEPEISPSDNTGTVVITVPGPVAPVADLGVTKVLVTQGPFRLNQRITYRIVVTNFGPADATGVVATEVLPASLTFFSASASAGTSFDPSTGLFTIGNLANGASATLTITAIINSTGSIVNNVTVTGNQIDPNPGTTTGGTTAGGTTSGTTSGGTTSTTGATTSTTGQTTSTTGATTSTTGATTSTTGATTSTTGATTSTTGQTTSTTGQTTSTTGATTSTTGATTSTTGQTTSTTGATTSTTGFTTSTTGASTSGATTSTTGATTSTTGFTTSTTGATTSTGGATTSTTGATTSTTGFTTSTTGATTSTTGATTSTTGATTSTGGATTTTTGATTSTTGQTTSTTGATTSTTGATTSTTGATTSTGGATTSTTGVTTSTTGQTTSTTGATTSTTGVTTSTTGATTSTTGFTTSTTGASTSGATTSTTGVTTSTTGFTTSTTGATTSTTGVTTSTTGATTSTTGFTTSTTGATTTTTGATTSTTSGGTTGDNTDEVPICVIPSTPDIITGPPVVCTGQTAAVYSVRVEPGVDSYTFTLPIGWTVTNGTGNVTTVPVTANATTVQISASVGNIAGPNRIFVVATNECGSSSASNLDVTVTLTPAAAGPITPSATGNICSGTTVTFSVADIPGATSYVWTVPTTGGWAITGNGQGTKSITVTAGSTSGNVTVTGVNGICSGATATLPVTGIQTPSPAGTITSSVTGNICSGSTVTFSVASIAGATSYTWTVPTGWTIVSGQGSMAITVTAGATSGNVTVTGMNGACLGTPATLPVTGVQTPGAAGAIIASASGNICSGTTVTFSVGDIMNATSYMWTVPTGWTILSGQGTKTITVTAGATSGNVTVAGLNGACPGAANTLAVTGIQTPGPLTITDTSNPCTGLSFRVEAVPGATTYNWTVSEGLRIVSGQTTTSVVIEKSNPGLTSGTISVTAVNGTCSSPTATATVDPSKGGSVLFFPNAFSPNGDGLYDTWQVTNLLNFPDNEVVIYNRWGNEVYRKVGYKNDWTATGLEQGTYFYVFRVKGCDNQDTSYKGYVSIYR